MSNDDIPDNKFWLALWLAGMSTLLCIVITLSISSVEQRKIRAELIKAGIDPIALECAESSGATQAPICSKLKDGR